MTTPTGALTYAEIMARMAQLVQDEQRIRDEQVRLRAELARRVSLPPEAT